MELANPFQFESEAEWTTEAGFPPVAARLPQDTAAQTRFMSKPSANDVADNPWALSPPDSPPSVPSTMPHTLQPCNFDTVPHTISNFVPEPVPEHTFNTTDYTSNVFSTDYGKVSEFTSNVLSDDYGSSVVDNEYMGGGFELERHDTIASERSMSLLEARPSSEFRNSPLSKAESFLPTPPRHSPERLRSDNTLFSFEYQDDPSYDTEFKLFPATAKRQETIKKIYQAQDELLECISGLETVIDSYEKQRKENEMLLKYIDNLMKSNNKS